MMKSKRNLLLLIVVFLAWSYSSFSQPTGINLNEEDALRSYTLFEGSIATFLVDNCGDVVNIWQVLNPDLHCKLLPNGNIYYLNANRVYIRDWDDNVIKVLQHNGGLDLHLVYEMIAMPNGNFLAVVRRELTRETFESFGFRFEGIRPEYADGVVELDGETGEIVWEWSIIDHVIQDQVDSVHTFGVVAENPQLLDINAISKFDFREYESFMINGMDYNPALDQIMFSVRKLSEFIIIDHSTTTEEAAGHTGGKYGKGGDILYRWGNPANYGQGDETDRQLFYQHNPHWILEGPYKGQIMCFNNGLARNFTTEEYSSVPIISPPIDADGHYSLAANAAFEPALPTLEYDKYQTGTDFYSGYTSGASFMPNGNIFITEGVKGRLFEINPQGEVVWQYTIPFSNYIFRSQKYAVDFPAFEGKDLSPGNAVPGSTSGNICQLYTATTEAPSLSELIPITYDSQSKDLTITNDRNEGFYFYLYSLDGQVLQKQFSPQSLYRTNLGNVARGVYVVSVGKEGVGSWRSWKVFVW